MSRQGSYIAADSKLSLRDSSGTGGMIGGLPRLHGIPLLKNCNARRTSRSACFAALYLGSSSRARSKHSAASA